MAGQVLEETSGETTEEDLKEEIGHEMVQRTDLGAEAGGTARWTLSQEEIQLQAQVEMFLCVTLPMTKFIKQIRSSRPEMIQVRSLSLTVVALDHLWGGLSIKC